MALINKLSDIAEAVRERSGYTGGLTLEDMAIEIKAIPYPVVEEIEITENGTYEPPEGVDGFSSVNVNIKATADLPEEAFNITGNCQYRFANGGWDWFIELGGDKIRTSNINNCNYMFYGCESTKNILFDINISKDLATIAYCFNNCTNLEEVPYIIGPADKALPTSGYSGCITIDHLFQGCQNLRYIPDDYFWKIVPNEAYWDKWCELNSQASNAIFQNCYSLRKLPADISRLKPIKAAYYSSPYNSMCYNCHNLDEIIDLPVLTDASYTSNAFSSCVDYCFRLKDFTFATNEDGTPKTAKWKNQTLSFTSNVGNYGVVSGFTNCNSGITADKEVKDDATYQALKNDPDWFATHVDYSRYNHDSAVRTIMSLPDCSATGTNIIKFYGRLGAKTDGGAINTLTEEEIAVATAKGWTVSLS